MTEIKPEIIVAPGVEVAVNEVYKIDGVWKFTLASYRLLEDRSIQFNLVVENLQNKPADIVFFPDSELTYVLDNLSKKYFKPTLSVKAWERVSFIQHMPVTISVTFPSLQQGVKTVVLYLYLRPQKLEGLTREERLYFGPITLK